MSATIAFRTRFDEIVQRIGRDRRLALLALDAVKGADERLDGLLGPDLAGRVDRRLGDPHFLVVHQLADVGRGRFEPERAQRPQDRV